MWSNVERIKAEQNKLNFLQKNITENQNWRKLSSVKY